MKAIAVLTVFLAFAAMAPSHAADDDSGPRDWTSADGSKTLSAEYVSSRDGKVTIRRAGDRNTLTVDLVSFSEADREWVKAREAKKAPGPGLGGGGEEMEASETFSKLISGEWERTEGHGLQYRLYGERKMRRSKDGGYPLLVYLHGKNGDVMTPDQPGQARVFSGEDNYRERPCFIIAPQNPDQMGWKDEKAAGVVAIVKELVENLPIDPKRIYLTGYSMGAYGTFRILADQPELFAAGVPVAGGGSPGTAESFKDVPVWVFHGAMDPTVKVTQSQQMVEALKAAGADPKYTEYPDGDHGVIGEAYGDEEMHEWLFQQRQAE